MSALRKGRAAMERGVTLGRYRVLPPSFDLAAEPWCSFGSLWRWCCATLILLALTLVTCPLFTAGIDSLQHNVTEDWLTDETSSAAKSEIEPNAATADFIERIENKLAAEADQAIMRYERFQASLTSRPDSLKILLHSFGLADHEGEQDVTALLQTPVDNSSQDMLETSESVVRNLTTSTIPDAVIANRELTSKYLHKQLEAALGSTPSQTSVAVSEFVHRRLTDDDASDPKRSVRSWLDDYWLSRVKRWRKMFRFRYLVPLFGMAITFMYVCYMYPGAHPANRPFAYHGQATMKTPPGWCVEQAHAYSLRSWLSDLVLWSASTDVEPQRQGPMAALQITGMARDLVREIPPHILRDGQVDQAGVHTTGLMILAQNLTNRFMPMEAELATRALAELMSFARLNDETLDACLVRFDVLRNRAAQRGGMGMTVQGMSWLLLRGLRINPEMWDRVLTPLDGQLPQNEAQFNQLVERVRRVGRLYEGGYHHQHRQGATGHVGEYHFFPSFEEPQPSFVTQQPPFAPNQSFQMPSDFFGTAGPSGPSFEQGSFVAGSCTDADAMRCNSCGMFYEDDDCSSATESDLGEPDHEAQQTFSSFASESEAADALYSAYLLAKQRWRRFSGRPPRRYRKNHFNKGKYQKQYRHLSQGPYARAYASFLPPKAFAANRNPGQFAKRGSGGPKKNPRGRDGQPLKCHKCGSDEHLLKRCPQNQNKNQGPQSSSSMAMLTSGIPSLPSMHFMMNSSMTQESPLLRSVPSSSQASVRDEIESLRSTSSKKPSITLEEVSSRSQDASLSGEPKCPPPAHEAPTLQEIHAKSQSLTQWTSFVSGQAASLAPQGLQSFAIWTPRSNQSQPTSLTAASQKSHEEEIDASSPRPSQQAEKRKSSRSSPVASQEGADKPSPEKLARVQKDKLQEQMQQATTLQLSQLLHGFVGSGSRSSASSVSQKPRQDTALLPDKPEGSSYWPWWERIPREAGSGTAYHSVRTHMPDGRIGLLVDPGAHDNLAGEATMRLLSRQVCGDTEYPQKHLDRPLQVSGVGTNAQESNRAGRIDFRLRNEAGEHIEGSYTAPYIDRSSLPALLGLKSLRGRRCVLDMHAPALIVPGEGGIEYRLSPGSQVFRLEVSPSGHLILPVEPVRNEETEDECRGRSTLTAEQRLDFNVRCRNTRSVTPVRHAVELKEQFVHEASRCRLEPRSRTKESSSEPHHPCPASSSSTATVRSSSAQQRKSAN